MGVAVEVIEERSAIVRKERARKGGKTGGRHHPKDVSLSAQMADKLKNGAKQDTRTAVALEHGLPENKLRDVAGKAVDVSGRAIAAA